MYKTDIVLNYPDFHNYFTGKRFYDGLGHMIYRMDVYELAYENKMTYQEVEKSFTIKELEK